MNNLIFNRFLLFFALTFSSFSTFSQLLYYPIYNTINLDGSPKFGKYDYKFFEPFYAPLQNSFISAPHLIDQGSYELIFEDEFSSYQFDPQKWNLPHEIQGHSKLHAGGGTTAPGEIGWQAFPNNYEFTGSSVKLIAKELNTPQMLKCIEYDCTYTVYGDNKPNLRLHKYSGGFLESNFNYKYGYYEAKIKLPIIENVWPAFWFFENKTEIDVFEMLRGREEEKKAITSLKTSSRVFMTYHFWNHNIGKSIWEQATLDIFSNPQRTTPYSLSNQWHTWGLLWDDFRIIWLLDGNVLFTVYHYILQVNKNVSIPISNNQQLLAVMNHPLLDKLKVNWGYPSEQSKLIIGMNPTNFSSSIDSDNAFTLPNALPKSLEIDYVKIYAFRNCNTDLNFCDGKDLPTHILGKTVTIGSSNYNQFPCNQVVKSKGGCFGEPLCSIKNDNALQYVHCVATDKISLKPGFKVEKGAYFHGRIENCNTANLRTGNHLPQGLQNVINNQAYEDSLFYA